MDIIREIHNQGKILKWNDSNKELMNLFLLFKSLILYKISLNLHKTEVRFSVQDSQSYPNSLFYINIKSIIRPSNLYDLLNYLSNKIGNKQLIIYLSYLARAKTYSFDISDATGIYSFDILSADLYELRSNGSAVYALE